MNQSGDIISVVAPVYNEEELIDVFYERTSTVLRGLEAGSYELIFIDDGSHDRSYEKLIAIAERDRSVKLVKFSRNFGHQRAITAGIDIATGDAVIIIDADLQDPPEVIEKLVEKWREGYDVAFGIRAKRDGEKWAKKFTAWAYYRLLRGVTGENIPADVGDFRLMSRRVADEMRKLREHDRFMRGIVSWVGFKQTGVEYNRDKRFAGKTKFPWRRMVSFALDGVLSFTTLPLRLAVWLGYLASMGAFLYLISVFIQWTIGITVEGWATIMVALLFVGGVQLICIGIMGEYIGRIYMATKARPLYIVDEVFQVVKENEGE